MSVTAVLRQMAEHLPFRRLRFRKSHDFQGLQVSDLQIGAVAYRLNRLFDGGGCGQEKTVRVHPSSRRILELRASSCLFRKTDGASSKTGFAGTKASRVAAGQKLRDRRAIRQASSFVGRFTMPRRIASFSK